MSKVSEFEQNKEWARELVYNNQEDMQDLLVAYLRRIRAIKNGGVMGQVAPGHRTKTNGEVIREYKMQIAKATRVLNWLSKVENPHVKKPKPPRKRRPRLAPVAEGSHWRRAEDGTIWAVIGKGKIFGTLIISRLDRPAERTLHQRDLLAGFALV